MPVGPLPVTVGEDGHDAGGVGQGVFDRPFHTLDSARPARITAIHPVGPDLRIDWEL